MPRQDRNLEWVDEAFTNPKTREPYAIPADLKQAALHIAFAYGIRGICDPMYIANVIAKATGRGDGQSHFYAPEDVAHSLLNHSGTSGAVMCPICQGARSNAL